MQSRAQTKPQKDSNETPPIAPYTRPCPTRKGAPKAEHPQTSDDATTAKTAVDVAKSSSETNTEEKAKRQLEIEDNREKTGPAKKAKTAAKTTPKPRPQSPTRKSQRPATINAVVPPKRKRRTKAEIEADKAKEEAEKEAKRQQKDKLTADKHRAMKQMDMDEDVDRAESTACTIRTFSELELDSGQEEFIGYDEVLTSDDSESGNDTEKRLKLKETNKALQQRIETLEAKVHGGKKNEVGGKKSTKKVTFASGLRPDWNNDKPNRPTEKNHSKPTYVEISTGGLEDSDAEDVNPFSSGQTKVYAPAEFVPGIQAAKRDYTRQNDLVAIDTSDNEDEYIPHPQAKRVQVKGCAKPLHPIQVKTEPRKPAVKFNRETMPPTISTTVAKFAKTKIRRLNGNSVRVADLPEFAQAKWRSTFLPTLYDKLFTSEQPFDGFNHGSDRFVSLLQDIINEVYPEAEYEVTSSDSLHYLAYNRINEKRSSIGSSAIEILEKHTKSLGVDDTSDWLRWALRVMDGPLFFKEPTPINSPTDQRDPAYRFPAGRLLSPFIVSVAASFFRLRAGSASENGFPKGLIAMIMAALERAVRYLSKPLIKPKEFSKEFWGAKVATYYNGLDGVSDTRWKELIELCGGSIRTDDNNDTLDADLSILDNNRAFVFNFDSPMK